MSEGAEPWPLSSFSTVSLSQAFAFLFHFSFSTQTTANFFVHVGQFPSPSSSTSAKVQREVASGAWKGFNGSAQSLNVTKIILL